MMMVVMIMMKKMMMMMMMVMNAWSMVPGQWKLIQGSQMKVRMTLIPLKVVIALMLLPILITSCLIVLLLMTFFLVLKFMMLFLLLLPTMSFLWIREKHYLMGRRRTNFSKFENIFALISRAGSGWEGAVCFHFAAFDKSRRAFILTAFF